MRIDSDRVTTIAGMINGVILLAAGLNIAVPGVLKDTQFVNALALVIAGAAIAVQGYFTNKPAKRKSITDVRRRD